TRDGGRYIVSSEGGGNPQEDMSTATVAQRKQTNNGLFRLKQDPKDENKLLLQKKNSSSIDGWSSIQSFSYNRNNGADGYSFSPTVDEDGNTSFVYADNVGNIIKVDFNMITGERGTPIDLIPNTDTL